MKKTIFNIVAGVSLAYFVIEKIKEKDTVWDWAENGKVKKIKKYIQNNGDINVKDELSNSPLFYAIDGGNIDIVKILIDNGANINLRNEGKMTALMLASLISNIEMVELLIENGADPTLKDEKGGTALMFAVDYYEAKADPYIVKLLIENGANKNTQNDDGKTALDIAKVQSNNRMIEILEEK